MGKSINSGNYMQLVPNDMIDLFTNLYSNPNTFSVQPTKMLWGQPGIGKSQAVHELAKHLESATHKKVVVTTASLLLMSPIDLRGIPTKDTNSAGELVAKWLTPEIFKMDNSDKVINILFLDEISAAPPSVQAAAYQICLDKRVGEHKLPANCFVIAAGNRVTDKAVAYKMPKPLGNRLTHFEMVCSVEDWKKWAYKHDIDTRIIGFINHDHTYLNKFDADTDDVAFPTPRSWEMVDTYLKSAKSMVSNSSNMSDEEAEEKAFNKVFSCIAGSIGLGTASSFKTYIAVYDQLPQWSAIASGKLSKMPKNIATCRPDVMYALSTMIASRCNEEAKKVNLKKESEIKQFQATMDNVCTFIGSISKMEYVVLCCKDIFRSNESDVVNLIMGSEKFNKLMDSISEEM